MTLETIQALIETGGLYTFTALVWWELRQMRTEMLSILNRLDERTRQNAQNEGWNFKKHRFNRTLTQLRIQNDVKKGPISAPGACNGGSIPPNDGFWRRQFSRQGSEEQHTNRRRIFRGIFRQATGCKGDQKPILETATKRIHCKKLETGSTALQGGRQPDTFTPGFSRLGI